MPMELRKRKTPPPPPPPRQKRAKAAPAEKKEKAAPAKRVKDAVVSKGEKAAKVVEAVAEKVEEKVTEKPAKATKAKAAPKKTAAQEKKEKAAAEKKAAAEEKKAEEKKDEPAVEEKKEEAPKPEEKKEEAPKAEEKKEEKKPEEKKEDAPKTEVKTLKVGDSIPEDLTGVKTDDGEETTIKALLEKSDKGIVVFAYPSANTPGCTKQACHFRDSLSTFTTAGYAVYGLSGDSPKKNKSFNEKHKFGYPLLCDEGYTLHDAFGIKKTGGKGPSTHRSVFALTKDGKISLLEKGTPDGTFEAAKKFVAA